MHSRSVSGLGSDARGELLLFVKLPHKGTESVLRLNKLFVGTTPLLVQLVEPLVCGFVLIRAGLKRLQLIENLLKTFLDRFQDRKGVADFLKQVNPRGGVIHPYKIADFYR
jgi:hypothetical protein